MPENPRRYSHQDSQSISAPERGESAQSAVRQKRRRWARRGGLAVGLLAAAVVCGVLAARAYLTGPRLTGLVREQLAGRFTGEIRVDAVRWHLPLTVVVQGLQVNLADHSPEATLGEARATLHLLPLLRRHISFGSVRLQQAVVRLRPTASGDPNTFALFTALSPRQAAAGVPGTAAPSDTNSDTKFAWPIEVADITLAAVDVHLCQPAQRIDVIGLHVEDATVRAHLAQQTFAATGSVGAAQVTVVQAATGQRIVVAPLQLRFENGEATLRTDSMQAHVDLFALQTPGLTAALHMGDMDTGRQAPEGNTPCAHPPCTVVSPSIASSGHVEVTADLTAPLWPQVTGATQWAQLRPMGQAHFTVDARSHNDRQSAAWSLEGTNLRVAGVPLQGGSGMVAWEAPTLTLGSWRFVVPGGAFALDANAQLDLECHSVQAHQVSVGAEHLPLRSLLTGPLADWAAKAPQSLSGQVTVAGKQLWPAWQTTYTLGLQATGLASTLLPTLPDQAALQSSGSFEHMQATVTQLALHADGARLAATGQVDFGGQQAFALAVTLVDETPDQTLKRFTPAVHLAGLTAHFNAKGTLRQPQGAGQVRLQGLRASPEPQSRTDVTLPFTLRHGIIRIRDMQVQGPALRAVATLQLALQGPTGAYLHNPDLDGEVHLRQLDLQAFLPNTGVSGRAESTLRIAGPLVAPRLTGQLRIANLQLGTLAFTEANTQLFSDGQHIGLRHLALIPREGGTLLGEAHFNRVNRQVAGTFNAHDVPAKWLGLKAPTPALFQASLTLGGTLDDLTAQLEANAGRLFALSADVRLQPPQTRLSLALKGAGQLSALAEWLEGMAALHGDVRVEMHADGDWHAPDLQATLTGQKMAYGGQVLGNANLRLSASNEGAGRYQLDLDAMNLVTAQARVQLIPNLDVSAEAHFDNLQAGAFMPHLAQHDAKASATGVAGLHYRGGAGHTSRLDAHVLLHDFSAEAVGRHISLLQPTRLTLNQDGVDLQTLHLKGSAGSLDVSGRAVGPWLAGTPQGANRTRLEAAATGKVDLAFVAALVPALGYASGEAVLAGELSGTQAHPVGSGRLRVANEWVLRPRGTLIEVHVATGAVALSPTRLELQNIRGTLESGTFALGGHIDLAHFKPQHYAVRLTGNDLPVHTPELMLEANVMAQAEGDGLLPLVKGRINLTRGRFLKTLTFKDFNFVAKEPDTHTPLAQSAPWLKDLRLDLVATSANALDVRIDAGVFAVDTALQTDLHITGNALVPHTVGRIAAEHGTLHFPKADLQLTQAVIDFEPTLQDPMGAALSLQADGEFTPPGSATGAQTYNVALRLDGPVHALAFELTSDQGLSKLEILSLLTTGHVSLAELAGGQGDEGSQLDAALAFAGSQVSGPLTHLAERQLERALKLRLELGAEVSQENVRFTAAKNVNRRLRLEGAYTHGIAADQAIVSTRAQLSLTDRLLLEGSAARDLSGSTATGTVQSNLELKFRVIGQ